MNSFHDDLETPSIVVEPPIEEDVIDGQHLNTFPGMGSAEGVSFFYEHSQSSNPLAPEQGLFSNNMDQSTGHIAPLITHGLRDGGFGSDLDQLYTQRCGTASSGNVFLSPLSPSGQHSPVDAAWSPASSSSAFPDYASDDGSSGWSPSVSSPSSPSLSPINQSMNNIALNDAVSDDGTSFSHLSPRQRSNSYTGVTDFSVEQGASRPRSASFNEISSFDNQQLFLPEQQFHGQFMAGQNQTDMTFPEGFDFQAFSNNLNAAPASPSWDSFDSSSQQSSPSFPPQPDLQMQFQQFYQPPTQPPPGHPSHARSQSTHLTVPNLTRRGAQHKRHHSHTGIQDRGRGMVRVRSRQGSPSSWSRSSSRSRDDDVSSSSYSGLSPLNTIDLSDQSQLLMHHITPPSSASVSLSPDLSRSQSPSSPASSIDINVPPQQDTNVPVINVNDFDSFTSFELPGNSGVRRHISYAGAGSRSSSPSRAGPSGLHRVVSDPSGGRRQYPRKPRAPNTVIKFPGLLKPAGEVDDEATYKEMKSMEGTLNVSIGSVGGALEAGLSGEVGGVGGLLRGVGVGSDGGFKNVVGSDKILKASGDRRKNDAKFKCPICFNSFTAKHNLTNHLNSHNGVRPYECAGCGASFTTKGTFQRHASKCKNKASPDEGKLARKR
ncbi:hypothetical protein VKT23_009172 [Stygiomarasmius scandens]|uniref:C2H2-type domain-containing protein n=1 Tax=Marasmiellus scandens TaxID=2682957 RepID=A0ABR1JFM3_9AGAR